MKNRTILLLPGDGIGPEIVGEARKVLEKLNEEYSLGLQFSEEKVGGCSIDEYGVPLTEKALAACKAADAILLGAVGGPKWDNVAPALRPEKALLAIRKELGLFANLRPTKLFPMLQSSSPLRKEILAQGIDLLIVRELTGGVYFGEHTLRESDASDQMNYSAAEIERIARIAFDAAMLRRKKVTSVDKANVLACSRLWRQTLETVAANYPEVTLDHLYVDNCAMQLVRDPARFDVIVTENMFGDILSDEASMLTGSIGMMPSASLSADGPGMFEPIHGSAPDIAGKDIANPLGTILSAAMLLRYGLGEENAASIIETAVEAILQKGYRTADIYEGTPEQTLVGCSEMGNLVCETI